MSGGMMLPPHIARIFLPRPPLRYLPPTDVEPTKRKLPYVTGLGAYVDLLGKEDPDMPAYVPTKSHEQLRSERVYKSEGGVMGFDFTRACTFLKIARKTAEAEANRKRQQEEYNPKAKTEGKTIDPFKTLFVARLNPITNEDTLRRVFEQFGPVKSIHLVKNVFTGNSRRYAFVEMVEERDAKVALREGNGIKVDGNRMLVDIERSRTVETWKPRRLGGGLGGMRALEEEKRLQKMGMQQQGRFGGGYGGRGPPPPRFDRGPPGGGYGGPPGGGRGGPPGGGYGGPPSGGYGGRGGYDRGGDRGGYGDRGGDRGGYGDRGRERDTGDRGDTYRKRSRSRQRSRSPKRRAN